MQSFTFQLKKTSRINGINLISENITLSSLNKGELIRDMDNPHLALGYINNIISSSLFELNEITASNDKSDERIDDFFGFIYDFNIRYFDLELSQ